MKNHLVSVAGATVVIAIAAGLSFAIACGDDDDARPTGCAGAHDPACVTTQTPVQTILPDVCAGPTNAGGCVITPAPDAGAATAAAKADLATRLGVAADSVTVASTEPVDWPDSCLGVTSPGIACAQVITPGFRVTLEVGGQGYEYHTDSGTRVVYVP